MKTSVFKYVCFVFLLFLLGSCSKKPTGFPAEEGYKLVYIDMKVGTRLSLLEFDNIKSLKMFVFRESDHLEIARWDIGREIRKRGWSRGYEGENFSLPIWQKYGVFSVDRLKEADATTDGVFQRFQGNGEAILLVMLPNPNCFIAESDLGGYNLISLPDPLTFTTSVDGGKKTHTFFPSGKLEPFHGNSESFEIGSAPVAYAPEEISNLLELREHFRANGNKPKKAKNDSVSTIAMRALLSVAALLVGFGLMSHFLRDIFPQKADSSELRFLSNGTAICLSLLFAIWLFNATESDTLIGEVSKGLLGIVGSVIGIMFTGIAAYLFWKRVKAYFK